MAIAETSHKSPSKSTKGSKKEAKDSVKRTADGSPKAESSPKREFTDLEHELFANLAVSARAMDAQLKIIKQLFADNNKELNFNKRATKPQKDPEAPKRPASAYLLFQNDLRTKKDPAQSQTEFMAHVGAEWQSLGKEDKEKYQKSYQKACENFEKEREKYVKSGKEAAWQKQMQELGVPADAPKKKEAAKKKAEPKEKKDDKKEKKDDKKEETKPAKAKVEKKEEKSSTSKAASKSKKEEKKPEPTPAAADESDESVSESSDSDSDSDSGSSDSDSSESESEPEPLPEPPKKQAKKEEKSSKKSKK